MWKDRYHRRWQSVPTNTKAIASLVFGIMGLTALPLIGSIIAIVAGHLAKAEIRLGGDGIGGDGLANAGLVLGYLGVGLAVVGLCVIGGLIALFAAQSIGRTHSLLPFLLTT